MARLAFRLAKRAAVAALVVVVAVVGTEASVLLSGPRALDPNRSKAKGVRR